MINIVTSELEFDEELKNELSLHVIIVFNITFLCSTTFIMFQSPIP